MDQEHGGKKRAVVRHWHTKRLSERPAEIPVCQSTVVVSVVKRNGVPSVRVEVKEKA